jgi:hypothetical protein
MSPHRVGRVILDGVVPVSQWANGNQSEITRYIYRDTDKAFISFAEECAKVRRCNQYLIHRCDLLTLARPFTGRTLSVRPRSLDQRLLYQLLRLEHRQRD